MSDRLARYGWRVIVLAVAVAIVGGVFYAATWTPRAGSTFVDECVNPPCFGPGDIPGLRELPATAHFIGYGLAILFGVASAARGAWALIRGRPAAAGKLLLAFIGPFLILIGTEIVPHVLSPCLVIDLGICEVTRYGRDLQDRWHPLDHAVVGALPMAALYWAALRRWRPDLL